MNNRTEFLNRKSEERTPDLHTRIWSAHHVWPSTSGADTAFPRGISLIPENLQMDMLLRFI